MSAAQLLKCLCANCAQIKPDHESQLRPLIGVTLQQAQEAWEYAAKILWCSDLFCGTTDQPLPE